jgi:hypothetical protein
MEGDFDSYIYFIEVSLKLSKEKGYLGFIVPNNLLLQKFGRKIRNIILENTSIKNIVDIGFDAFTEAVVPTTIIVMTKTKIEDNIVHFLHKSNNLNFENEDTIEQSNFLNNDDCAFNLQISGDNKKVLEKILIDSKNLSDIAEIKIGIEGAQDFIHDKPVSPYCKPLVRGRNFNRYSIDFKSDPKYIVYDKKLLHRAREERLFKVPNKILIRQTGDRIIATIDSERLYAWKSVFVLLANEEIYNLKYILSVINSKVIDFFYRILVGEQGRTFAQIKGTNLSKIPIKEISIESQQPFIEKADQMIDLNKQFHRTQKEFLDWLKIQYGLEKQSKKLESFYALDEKAFFAELKKKLPKENKNISPKQTGEIKQYFEDYRQKIIALKNEIEKTDSEIDEMVYELYGLTKEEIEIVRR